MATMTPFQRAFREAKDAGRPDFEFPPRSGKIYSTKTAEEQSREIAKTAKGGKRGESAGMTAKDAETLYGRAQIPSGGGAKAPADTGMGGMSDTTRNVLTTLGALGVGGGAAGLGARALMRREAAKRAAEAEKLASRVTPTMRRSGEGVDEAMKQARAEMAREPQMGLESATRRLRPEEVTDDLVRSVVDKAYDKTYGVGFTRTSPEAMAQARREAAMAARSGSPATPLRGTNVTSETGRRFTPAEEMEAATAGIRGAAARKELASTRTGRSQAAAQAKAEKPVMRTEKKKETPRSRTRDTDEDVEFRRGGAVKTYAKGGSVRGAGCETRTKKTRFV